MLLYRWANRAKSIKNKPKINEDPKDALLREFQEEIARLKAHLDHKGGGAGGGAGGKKKKKKKTKRGPDGKKDFILTSNMLLKISLFWNEVNGNLQLHFFELYTYFIWI